MTDKLFFVYGIKDDGAATPKRVTDRENLKKCIKYALHDFGKEYGCTEVYVNRTYICFDGYLEQGDYIGSFTNATLDRADSVSA